MECEKMYESYISAENICFSRHFGPLEGGAGFSAIISSLESNPCPSQLKALCSDYREVTGVTLHSTDRAYGAGIKRKFASLGQQLSFSCVVNILNPENVAANELLAERTRRLAFSFCAETIKDVYSVTDALKLLGLPADYRIEYPAKN
tara:strand:- start:572 stop:1015 length:444 start_codon:yes stop_codon:yes gene_type:complete